MGSFRNASFEELIEGTLKRTAAALRDADVPYCLMGSLSAWARGGVESSHDLDFGIRASDMIAAAEALEGVGMRIEIPPEEWLIKAWDPATDERAETLVDLIYAPAGVPITDEVLARADVLQVHAQSMPVIGATDMLVMKLSSLREQNLDYTSVMAIARAMREQVDWSEVRERTQRSPYAAAFFTMGELLGIVPGGPDRGEPVQILSEMQAGERTGLEHLRDREKLAEVLRQHRGPGNGDGPSGYRPSEGARSAQTIA